jgi:hypothetical protein
MTRATYDTDFYTWTQEQAAALRDKNWAALDLERLAEEVEDVGNTVRFDLESQLVRLLVHLLKLAHDPTTRPRRGWRVTVMDARVEIAKRATGALQHYADAYLPTAYQHARHEAALATALSLSTFPEVCPWTVALMLDEDFWPEACR